MSLFPFSLLFTARKRMRWDRNKGTEIFRPGFFWIHLIPLSISLWSFHASPISVKSQAYKYLQNLFFPLPPYRKPMARTVPSATSTSSQPPLKPPCNAQQFIPRPRINIYAQSFKLTLRPCLPPPHPVVSRTVPIRSYIFRITRPLDVKFNIFLPFIENLAAQMNFKFPSPFTMPVLREGWYASINIPFRDSNRVQYN